MSEPDPRARLLHVSQYEVDFVIPRIGTDIPVGIDPFLLFKSRDPDFRNLHSLLLAAFNVGLEAVRQGKISEAKRLFSFPEVTEIGLGYAVTTRRGSGVGAYLAGLIIETLEGSPPLLERGVRHVEEMQLLSAGIGPDRISDIVANLLKKYLITYTQRQCLIWNLPTRPGVPINHIYNHSSHSWEDSYEDLPVSAADGAPILLVPRRIVRLLPWINYDDFIRTEFAAYLAARRDSARRAKVDHFSAKRDVTTVTRRDIALVERYVHSREQRADEARPALDYIDEDACLETEILKGKLASLPAGRERAIEYQQLVLEILNFLFSPELIDGQPEVRTIDGTERRDIVFTNDSDESFWTYIRAEHSGFLVMFEAKNTEMLEIAAVNQTATYLGDRLGRLGVIVTRAQPSEAIKRECPVDRRK